MRARRFTKKFPHEKDMETVQFQSKTTLKANVNNFGNNITVMPSNANGTLLAHLPTSF